MKRCNEPLDKTCKSLERKHKALGRFGDRLSISVNYPLMFSLLKAIISLKVCFPVNSHILAMTTTIQCKVTV